MMQTIARVVICGLAMSLAPRAVHQDTLPLVESESTRYYDFWIGRWAEIGPDDTVASEPSFIVTRGIHHGSLEETWQGTLKARAFRAWDKTAGRWMHVWISDNGLLQVWEGRKVGNDWYMFKEFDVSGDKYLSRQAILKRGAREAERVSERSDDGGRTWTLRFRQRLRRVDMNEGSQPGAMFALSVSDLEASVAWYSDNLGLKVVNRVLTADKIGVAILEGAGVMVELIQNDKATPRSQAVRQNPTLAHGIFKVGLIVHDLDRTLAELRKKGVEIPYGPYPAKPNQRANAMIKDNAGNLIQLIAK